MRKRAHQYLDKVEERDLEAVFVLLQKMVEKEEILKAKLTSRALKANEDIEAGRVMDKAEFLRRTKARLKK